jgi:hypothetical protein
MYWSKCRTRTIYKVVRDVGEVPCLAGCRSAKISVGNKISAGNNTWPRYL